MSTDHPVAPRVADAQTVVHRSWPQAIVFAAVAAFAVAIALRASAVLLLPVIGVLIYATGVFLGGFRYRVSDAGVEISNVFRVMTRVRLDEIAAADVVVTNALADWGGWGARGLGRTRAYLLGGDRALHLKLADRELWLGLKSAESLPDILARAQSRASA